MALGKVSNCPTWQGFAHKYDLFGLFFFKKRAVCEHEFISVPSFSMDSRNEQLSHAQVTVSRNTLSSIRGASILD